PLSKESLSQFEIYFNELIAWNKKINLTRITERSRVFIEHFLDSLLPQKFIPVGSNLADLGSGGGFPGVPLKIIRPDLRVTLIDSSLKKITFLQHLIRLLGLSGIDTFHTHLGDKTLINRSYEICIGRALAPLKKFLALSLPLKSPPGTIIAMKGPNFLRELIEAKDFLARQKIFLKEVEEFTLPFVHKKRAILIFG
ncbi:MAG: 16S rRNA (guanine(527)-N(7))-methyltransferase RsmG, partial [Desulfobacterota bacterium]|nr:16S rRNA (guanine(527)-N(7))-methyltransferase RsmG [Thermodesulfobacteriota bacterium]